METKYKTDITKAIEFIKEIKSDIDTEHTRNNSDIEICNFILRELGKTKRKENPIPMKTEDFLPE